MYNQKIMSRFINPYNAGSLKGSNGTGKAGDVKNGDFIKIFIKVDEENKIEDAKFKAYGSPVTIAICDYVCDLIVNRDIKDALAITSNDIIDFLDIPDDKLNVVYICLESVRNAIENYFKKNEKQNKD